jgi:hypothetical protein
MLGALTRRALCGLALTGRLAPAPPVAAVTIADATARFVGTRSGLLYFDLPPFFGNGFDDAPCRGRCLEERWTPDADTVDVAAASVVHPDGALVRIDYRVHRKFWGSDELVALSDGIGNGGSVLFGVGDGTVNAAVDELVRTLPPGVVRRAIVPAAFDLDRGTRREYPRPEPPGTTYLTLALRKPSASNSVGTCPGGDARYTEVDSCICGR